MTFRKRGVSTMITHIFGFFKAPWRLSNQLSQQPGPKHWNDVKRILGYLRGTTTDRISPNSIYFSTTPHKQSDR